jgi:hypothetical protein
MAITLSREAYLEFRCFGVTDRYPKDVRAAVTELRRRGYDASLALLQYMVEEGLAEPDGDYWSESDIDGAAQELEERRAYTAGARKVDTAPEPVFEHPVGRSVKRLLTTLPCAPSSVLRRRMPADGDPTATSLDNQRIVHIQGQARGTADGRDSHNLSAVQTPAKVVPPAIAAGMEEPHLLAGHRVSRLGLCAFELVTRMTSEA